MTHPLGTQLEQQGWRQGSVVCIEDNSHLLANTNLAHEDQNIILILASQSCDIANNQLEDEPFIELSVARPIQTLNGNYSFNKNPRILHSQLSMNKGGLKKPCWIELKAYEKLSIDKKHFEHITPDNTTGMTNKNLESYVLWLAARYHRPALPSEFNRLIANSDPKEKLKKLAKQMDADLSGIYIKITPDSDIKDNQNYVVRLLGLVAADFSGDIEKIQEIFTQYASVIKASGMDVKDHVRREDQISVAILKAYQRFYYDDLSIKNDSSMPLKTVS